MTHSTQSPDCPVCGEPVKPHWRLCPACEASLARPACPACGAPVKPAWKRCPECEARLKAGAGSPTTAEEAAAGEQAPARQWTEPVTEMEFLWVPAGMFQMGDLRSEGADDEQPARPVSLDGFFMGRFPVTQRVWQSVMTDNPSRFPGPDRPVEQVTFSDVAAFTERLNDSAQGRWHLDLPSEAQWEYAARSGGRQERFAGGEDIHRLGWTDADPGEGTRPVGTKTPNGLGLYDMSGNVWEWCRDVYAADAYGRLPERNPVCAGPGTDRVIRGGAWHLDAWSARCSRRTGFSQELQGPALGFRLVCAGFTRHREG